MKILFYGTPDFAVASLKALIDAKKNVIGVVTAPDKPAGRGYQLKQSAVKEYALENNIPVFQPTNLKSEEFQKTLSQLQPDLQIVVAFRMLPESVWSFPKLGTFNLHGSLLPSYRGAAPINWAIINGEQKTGVTTFFLVHEIDTGSIILQQDLTIGKNETAGEIHDKLMVIGANLVVSTVNQIEKGKVSVISQEELINKGNKLCHAPKLNKELCKLNPNDDIEILHNKIRGLSPFPGSFFKVNCQEKEKIFKIYRSSIINSSATNKPIFLLNDDQLFFQNSSGTLHFSEVQIEGKKRMKDSEFLKGINLEELKPLAYE